MKHFWRALWFACALTACHKHHVVEDKDPPAVCALVLPKHLEHTNPDELPAEVWYSLLFKGYKDGIVNDPVDCSGEPVAWTPLPNSCAEGEPVTLEKERKHELGQADLVIRNAGGEYWFGWAPFVSFDNGMSEGPLAIARLHKGKLEVRAIGNLRAYAKRPRLEVRKLGKEHILAAEGELCDDKQKNCQRATRLMWLDRQHFRVRPLRSATVRNCLGPAWFPQTELLSARLNKRWNRVLQRDVALAYQEGMILVDEHITVNDRDGDAPTLPPRLFREAQAQIRVTLEAGEFLSEGQSLWNAIRIEDGSTELQASARNPP